MDDIRPAKRQQPLQPVTPTVPPQQDKQVKSDSPEAVMAETPEQQKTRIGMDHKISKRRKGPIIAIVFAVIVTVGLIGGAVYLFWRSRKTTDTNTIVQTEVTSEQTTSNKRVDVQDIDTTVADIDKQLNTLDDSNDFTNNTLSDTTLGL